MRQSVVDSLGHFFAGFSWQGGGRLDPQPSGIPGCFVDSVRSLTLPAGESPYVEGGFYKLGADDYFMLVNRRAYDTIPQTVRSWLNLDSAMYYIVDMYSYDSVLTGSISGRHIPFTSTLPPGEGKLYKIIPVPAYVSGSSLPATWEGGIRVGGNVTMAAGRTWKILPPARIRVDTVGSYTIDVYGNMIAEGTASDTIHFVSNSPSPHENNWYGIRVLGAGDVTATYADFRHAYKGLWLWNTTDTITATIDHCSFIQHYLAGAAFDANAASAISVRNSTFGNSRYYGVWIHRGKIDVDTNRFTNTGLNGVRIDGSSQSATGGHIRNNTFDSWLWPTSSGVWINGVRDDGLDWRNENFLQDNVFTGWTGVNQTGILIHNCQDTMRFLRNAIRGAGWKPGYGILNNSTRIFVTGDLTTPESVSAIWGTGYGIYSFSGSPNDPDYPIVRKCSSRSDSLLGVQGYDIWVSDEARINLGVFPDSGNNAFWGKCGSSPSEYVPVYTVYNSNQSETVMAQGNYWGTLGGFALRGDGLFDVYRCTHGPITLGPILQTNPFQGGGLEKVSGLSTSASPLALTEFGHLANYPNPFNSATVLHFSLSDPGLVEVAVYNVLGQKVKTICQDNRSVGEHQVTWDGRDEQGRPVSSGVYFYTVASGDQRLSKSIVLLK